MDHLFNLFLETAAVPMLIAGLIAWQVARPGGWNKGWRWTGAIVFVALSAGLIVAVQVANSIAPGIVGR